MRAADIFYKTIAWRQCREAYAASVGGLCEECLRHGRYEPGIIVHHKVHLTPDNYNDPSVALNWENLELLCRQCHADKHKGRVTRFVVDEFGHIAPR